MSYFRICVAVVLLISSGLVHAWFKGGWQTAKVLEAAALRVKEVPLKIGPWQGKELESDEREFNQAGALAYWTRQYQSALGSVTVLLMCGKPGRMAAHTPEFCYQGLGYQMVHAADPVEAPGGPNRFWTARFTKEFGSAHDLRLFWSWNSGTGWKAPANPRWEFRGAPFLYKLYLVQETTSDRRAEHETAFEFLKVLLPELDRSLFASESALRGQNLSIAMASERNRAQSR